VAMLESVGLTPDRAEAIYRLTTTPTMDDRFVLPPYHREMSIEAATDPLAARGSTGFGAVTGPRRGS